MNIFKKADNIKSVLTTSVADPHHIDADPDPTTHFFQIWTFQPILYFFHLSTLMWIRTLLLPLMQIRIQLSTLIRIRIQLPKMMWINLELDPQHGVFYEGTIFMF
jgi:hypothetical protein